MGPAAGAVASMQALEILKLILGLETLRGKFSMLDFRHGEFHVFEMKKAADCRVCGDQARLVKKFNCAVAVNYITPEDLKARLLSPRPPKLLDLRFEWERGLCHIQGNSWADFGELVKNGCGLGLDEEIVLYCKGQSKSTAALGKLRDMGYRKVSVLQGGIDAWAEKVDKGMARY